MQEWKFQPYRVQEGRQGGVFPLVVVQLLRRGHSQELGMERITHPSLPLCCCLSPQLGSCWPPT